MTPLQLHQLAKVISNQINYPLNAHDKQMEYALHQEYYLDIARTAVKEIQAMCATHVLVE